MAIAPSPERKTEPKPAKRKPAPKEVEENPESFHYKTWVLKVCNNCECKGCKGYIRETLRKIEGVYTTNIDLSQQKVTVIGNVDSDTLIKKLLEETGKHAELWSEKAYQKQKKQGKGKSKEKQSKPENSREEAAHGGKEEKETVKIKVPAKSSGENGNSNTGGKVVKVSDGGAAGKGGGQLKEAKTEVKQGARKSAECWPEKTDQKQKKQGKEKNKEKQSNPESSSEGAAHDGEEEKETVKIKVPAKSSGEKGNSTTSGKVVKVSDCGATGKVGVQSKEVKAKVKQGVTSPAGSQPPVSESEGGAEKSGGSCGGKMKKKMGHKGNSTNNAVEVQERGLQEQQAQPRQQESHSCYHRSVVSSPNSARPSSTSSSGSNGVNYQRPRDQLPSPSQVSPAEPDGVTAFWNSEHLKYETWVLKVFNNCECKGCKRYIREALRKIEGVYTTNIDLSQQKVTVIGNVDSDTLIKKLLEETGKHAELWSEKAYQKQKKQGKGKSKEKQSKPESSREEAAHGGKEEKETVKIKVPAKSSGENGNSNTGGKVVKVSDGGATGKGGGQLKEAKTEVKQGARKSAECWPEKADQKQKKQGKEKNKEKQGNPESSGKGAAHDGEEEKETVKIKVPAKSSSEKGNGTTGGKVVKVSDSGTGVQSKEVKAEVKRGVTSMGGSQPPVSESEGGAEKRSGGCRGKREKKMGHEGNSTNNAVDVQERGSQRQQAQPHPQEGSLHSWYPPPVVSFPNSTQPPSPSSSGSNSVIYQRPTDWPQSPSYVSHAEVAAIIALLEEKSVDELQELLSDKDAYNQFLLSVDQIQYDELCKETLQLARSNLEKEPQIMELRNQCMITRTTELAAAQEKLSELEKQKEDIMKFYSPASILYRLHEAVNKTEEESEALHRQLLDREIDLGTFVHKYKKLRNTYHRRALIHLAAKTSSIG